MATRQSKPAKWVNAAPVLPLRDTVHFPGVIQTLLVGREMSVKAFQTALKGERETIVVGQQDQTVDEPSESDLYRYGILSEILHVLPLPDGTLRVVLRGLARVAIQEFEFKKGSFSAKYEVCEPEPVTSAEVDALVRECLATFNQAVSYGLPVPPEVSETLASANQPGQLADLMAHHLPVSAAVKQSLLEELSVVARLTSLLEQLTREMQVLELQSNLRNKVERELGQTQREYFLREQMKAIQNELGGDEVLSAEGEEYLAKLHAANMPAECLEKAIQEVKRLERAPVSSPEGMVIRNYLDWLVDLPWNIQTNDMIDVRRAAKILDRDHHGLAPVKDRILDFLAVRQLSGSLRGPILCFVGPPGVGKTSIGRSIAEALGRKFQRISLGGVRDESEIRGHRRTYIGSMPGRLLKSLKTAGTRNPVLMLDEVDKMTTDYRGDPTSALLEALDPEQNSHFSDHYVEIPFDLSSVMFIATANLLEDIPAPLRDRMEIIRFPSYIEKEKISICKRYLLPKQVSEHGLKQQQIKIGRGVYEALVREHTREAGVRSLERAVATLCRKAARMIAEGHSESVHVTCENLGSFLGRAKYRYGVRSGKSEIGAATGLVYSEHGGDIVTIEAILTEPYGEQPTIQLTGSLGDVMKESALAAMTYVRANRSKIGRGEFRHDIHIHVPEGGVPKDGPSAGVTMLTAIASAFSGRAVRSDVAMTGEITLRGRVLGVGGVREKVLAAHRAGIRHVILPKENERDLDDLPTSVRERLTFELVEQAEEVLAAALRP